MKINKQNYLYLICIIIISGCASNEIISTPFSTETQLPSPTSVTPTSKPTSTLQPMATATLTPPATLNPEVAKETLKTLLNGSTDCLAPCFWGITPGLTTLGEAKNIFTRLGLELLDKRRIEYEFENGLLISATLRVQKDWIVENLSIYITPEIKREGVEREWLAYSLETLITRYGVPSKVEIAVDTGPRTFLSMEIYFDAFDLIVQYTGYGILVDTNQICPLIEQFDSVRIWMGENPEKPPSSAVSLEEATSLTTEVFSQLMTGNPNKACFDLNKEIFP